MTPRVPVSVCSHDPAWEARWDEANGRFQSLSGAAGAVQMLAESDDEFDRRLSLMRQAGSDMQAAFLAQFRTVAEYVIWRLYWLRGSLPRPFLNDLRIPADLTVAEVRSRFEEAYPVLNRIIARGPDNRCPEDEAQMRSILSRSPSSEICQRDNLRPQHARDHV